MKEYSLENNLWVSSGVLSRCFFFKISCLLGVFFFELFHPEILGDKDGPIISSWGLGGVGVAGVPESTSSSLRQEAEVQQLQAQLKEVPCRR